MSSEHSLAKRMKRFVHFQSYKKVQEKNLQPWNVKEENSNRKSDDGGNEDIDILHWRVLERAQSAASSCEQITNRDVEKDEGWGGIKKERQLDIDACGRLLEPE